MIHPKFNIGDIVNHKPDFFGVSVSKIVKIMRAFHDDDKNVTYIEDDLKYVGGFFKWKILEEDIPILIIYPHKELGWNKTTKKIERMVVPQKELKMTHYLYLTIDADLTNHKVKAGSQGVHNENDIKLYESPNII